MAWIEYGKADVGIGDRDNILRIHGVHARVMKGHFDLYRAVMRGPGPLTRVQREMIGVVVSAENGCGY